MTRRLAGLLATAGSTIIVLLLAASFIAVVTASRASTTRIVTVNALSGATLLVLLGPQSVCPPFAQCPQFQIKPKAISVWWIEGRNVTERAPLWQTYLQLSQRRLFYMLTE